MQNKVVLDSCVFNKIFLNEADKQETIDLLTELAKRKYQVLAPSLFLYEVLTIAGISDFSIKKASLLISQYQSANFELIDLNIDSINKAIEICEAGHKKSGFPSFYDASYHALAILNDCHFVTADKKHLAKTSQFGHIILLKDWKTIFK
jgi:predicted nucleic acid-binding protein